MLFDAEKHCRMDIRLIGIHFEQFEQADARQRTMGGAAREDHEVYRQSQARLRRTSVASVGNLSELGGEGVMSCKPLLNADASAGVIFHLLFPVYDNDKSLSMLTANARRLQLGWTSLVEMFRADLAGKATRIP